MPHDLATANHHDHAWTAKWAQNICALSMPISPTRLRYDNRQHGRRSHLYETKGTWKNHPTCFAVLDVGVMTILKRTDNYILIWPRNPVSLNSITVIFQNCPSSQTKLLRSLAFAAMLFFETMPLWSCMVGLIQLPNFYEGDLLSGSWALWVSGVEGVQGFLRGSWLQRLMNRTS